MPRLCVIGDLLSRLAGGGMRDVLALLTERAALLGLRRGGEVSCGGSSRLLRAADGWLAVTFAPSEDVEAVPAWLEREVDAGDPWPAVADAARGSPAEVMVGRAALLGLPVAALPGAPLPWKPAEPPFDGLPVGAVAFGDVGLLREPVTVVELGAVWAAPLCGRLRRLAGARVVKVESRLRPDGARGHPAFFALMNDGKEEVLVDLEEDGRVELERLVASADVVIGGSRPRALRHLGIVAEELLARPSGPAVWVSLTGHGCSGDAAMRVAFGDDAAVGGGTGRPPIGPAVAARRRDVGRGIALRRTHRARVTALVVRDVVLDGRRVSLRSDGGRVHEVGPDVRSEPGDVELDGGGGAVLPGLHDHHLHLPAMAAAGRSVRLEDDLEAALEAAHKQLVSGAWLRAVGYDERRHGALDRRGLDAVVPGRRVRVQHRSGAMWVLSSAGLDALDPLRAAPGVERDGRGVPTGRLFGLDEWGREHRDEDEPPDVGAVARRLASYGITGVTDATPFTSVDALALLTDETLAVQVVAMGGPPIADAELPPNVRRGPVKIILADHRLPSLNELVGTIRIAHAARCPVAVHCVASPPPPSPSPSQRGATPGPSAATGSSTPPSLAQSS